MTEVLVQRTGPTVQYPTRATDGSAGWDIYTHTITIDTHARTAIVGTGLKVAFPDTMVMCIFARSGLGWTYGLVPANGTGIIDSDYRGEIFIKFANLTPAAIDRLRAMRDGLEPERIAQALFLPVVPVHLTGVLNLPETVRGESGFGSTGA